MDERGKPKILEKPIFFQQKVKAGEYPYKERIWKSNLKTQKLITQPVGLQICGKKFIKITGKIKGPLRETFCDNKKKKFGRIKNGGKTKESRGGLKIRVKETRQRPGVV